MEFYNAATKHLVNASDPRQQTRLSRELLQAFVVGVDGSERLVESRVDFAEVQVRVDHVLLLLRRFELALGVAEHPESEMGRENVSKRSDARNTNTNL